MGLVRFAWIIRLVMVNQRPVVPWQKFWCKS